MAEVPLSCPHCGAPPPGPVAAWAGIAAISITCLVAIGATVIAAGHAPVAVLNDAVSAQNDIDSTHRAGVRPAACNDPIPGDGVANTAAPCTPLTSESISSPISTPLFSHAEIEAALKPNK